MVNDHVGRWRYTDVYGFPERGRRQDAWSMLRALAVRSSLSWCTIGNFNDLIMAIGKRGERNHPRNLLQGFSYAIVDCGLHDVGFQGEQFTWENFKTQDNGCKRG